MNEKLKHDSIKTFKPIIYQFLTALVKCFEMQENESVWIEKYGDVTNSNGIQIEVKDYQKELTDLDHNIWKTIKNWLDDGFNISYYHSLILLTTQNISEKSKFIDWNKKNKYDKLKILKDISEKFASKKDKSENTKKLLDNVLDPNKSNKLLEILEKLTIQSEANDDNALYKQLIETRTDGVLKEKKDEFINSLLGYIISPNITSNGWEIKNKDFRQKTKSLLETYTATTKIFPKIETISINNEDVFIHKSYPFVEKIENISYEEVISSAIGDFIYARKMLNSELKNYQISKKEYESYENEIFNSFKTKRRKALRDCDEANYINKSKNLYDDVTGETAPNFYNFNDTPKSYRNGLLHEIANDEHNSTKLVWKLEADNE